MKTERDVTVFRKADGAAIAGVVLCALALIALFALRGNEQAGTVKVYMSGQEVWSAPLDTDAEMIFTGEYTNKVEIRDGKAAITESDCPGEDCVHSGWIDRAGRSIVCLPNRLEVVLEGGAEDDVDAVVR